MKKTVFASMLAIGALLSASSFAQDATEYNMVITLQNGTTVTLGHNDIKNITFNGEEISIVGNAANSIQQNTNEINELWQQLSQTSEALGSLLNALPEDYASKPELEEAFQQIEQANITLTQMMKGFEEDYASKTDLEDAYMQIEQANITLTQFMKLVEDTYAANSELDEAFKQIEETKEMLSQALNVTDLKINSASEEIYNEIYGEKGIQEQMSQFHNAAMSEIKAVSDSNQELWENVYGDNGITEQMSMYYTANQAAINENTEGIDKNAKAIEVNSAVIKENVQRMDMLEDSLKMIADPTDEDSLVNRMSEGFAQMEAEMQDQLMKAFDMINMLKDYVNHLEAQIEELKAAKE